ncbi:MAG: sigma-70 family RNA polymerase sigma factor [Chthonomonas sp.]|nr:sigma-70 family RNA polymerase sigma factor [Chthonomonas sp.]
MNEVTDFVDSTALAIRARTGDESKAGVLSQVLRESFVKKFLAIGLGFDDANELAQDCVCEVMLNLGRFDENRANFQSWASGFARTHLRAWRRKELGRRSVEHSLEDVAEAAVVDEELNEVDCALRTCLGSLPVVDRELLIMRFSLGLSFDEIAERANLSSVNARKRLSRAMERLRRDPVLREALGM